MYLVYFNKLDFQKTRPDSPTIPVGDPVTMTRGEQVPAWVPEFQINALLNAGMIVYAADPDPRLVPLESLPPQVRTQDQPPVLPSDPNGVPPLLGDREPTNDTDEPADELPPLPKDGENKEVWEMYAQHPRIGMSDAEAEAMTKKDLVAEVKRRHAIAVEPVTL